MPRLEQMAANDTNSQEPNEENENLEILGPQEPVTRSGSVRSGSFRHHKHLHRHNQLGNRDGNNGGTDNDVSGRENVTQQPTNNRPGPRGANLTRMRSFYTPSMEDKLMRKLKFFFMGPHEKIMARKRIPWKLLIQIFKIALVTAQLVQFGYSRSSFVEFTEKSTIAMRHFFLKDWTNSYETMPYPPAIGKYALYTIDEITDTIDHAMQQYDKIERDAIGSLRFKRYSNHTIKPIKLCIHKYRSGQINESQQTYNLDSHVDIDCYKVGRLENGTYNITEYLLKSYNLTIDFDTVLILEMKFSLSLFRLEMKQRTFPPQLFTMDTTISMDDSNKDGQMLVTLNSEFEELELDGHSTYDDAQKTDKWGRVVLDVFVIIFTSLSALLCCRSVCRAQQLRRATNEFFKARHGRSMKTADQCEFVNLWYVTIIINDVLTMAGSGLKIQLETRNLKSTSNHFDYCSVMLGTGSLLAWLGVLRYIGFFQQFNILIVTLKKAFPNMLRFLTCCFMLYIGFVICGWVVLGPYHLKFRQMSTASECLFSLINGDDMFVTFSATVTNNQLVWYYSRFYLYLFISLFIYAVLNLFIAVIMDTYETIKEYYEGGFPKSELFEFIDKCTESASSPKFRQEDDSCSCCALTALCCCCSGGNPDKPDEYTRLIQ
ncbi:mucolipin-3-like [Mya arenaria]|uniref:mucolipin-3-like n=1 Tax=Mya arenaria TaxID=6604 RepID=UPI0022E5C69D|nr:mucolipin-3-like [Mya arenaria]